MCVGTYHPRASSKSLALRWLYAPALLLANTTSCQHCFVPALVGANTNFLGIPKIFGTAGTALAVCAKTTSWQRHFVPILLRANTNFLVFLEPFGAALGLHARSLARVCVRTRTLAYPRASMHACMHACARMSGCGEAGEHDNAETVRDHDGPCQHHLFPTLLCADTAFSPHYLVLANMTKREQFAIMTVRANTTLCQRYFVPTLVCANTT